MKKKILIFFLALIAGGGMTKIQAIPAESKTASSSDLEGFEYISEFTYVGNLISSSTSYGQGGFTSSQNPKLNMLKANVFCVENFYGLNEGQSNADFDVYKSTSLEKLGEFNFCWNWYRLSLGEGPSKSFDLTYVYDNMNVGDTKVITADEGTVYTFTLIDKIQSATNSNKKIVFSVDRPLYFGGSENGNVGISRFRDRVQIKYVDAKQTFLISFVNYDGSELQSSEVEFGETPAYTGETPTKPADAQYTYAFRGWTPEIVAVTGEATYTAVFEDATCLLASGTCGAEGDNLTWELSCDSVLTIGGSGRMEGCSLPWITYKERIKSVVIEDGITSIADSAFMGCPELTTVTIPESITRIERGAFAKCTNLSSITIPKNVICIRRNMFDGCTNLSSVIIKEGVISIEAQAFRNCKALTSIVLPNSIRHIMDNAFYGCINLSSVSLPQDLQNVGNNIFSGCDNLPVIDNIRYADTYLVEAVDKTLSSYTIRQGTKYIGTSAFSGCKNITSFSIPNTIIHISDNAFSSCSNLATISIPESVVFIGSAFQSCSSLPVIDNIRYADTYLVEAIDKTLSSYTIRQGTKYIGDNAFSGCKQITTFIIPNTIIHIGNRAFSSCSNLATISIPESVVYVGGYAFSGCDSLPVIDNIRYADTYLSEVVDKTQSSYTIHQGTRIIGNVAFLNCSNLTSITIPDSVTRIGVQAFYKCYNLSSVVLPKSIVNIKGEAFYDCNISDIFAPWETLPIIRPDFMESAKYYKTTLHVPAQSIDLYKTSNPWKEFTNILPIGGMDIDHPTNPGTYQLTLNASIADAGVLTGAGMYAQGTEVSVSAAANTGYTFERWSDGVTDASRTITMTARDSTLTAIFSINRYTVTFVDEDGTTVLSSDECDYGATPVAPAAPTKAATAQYTYTFNGWSPAIATVTEAATYTATYSQTVNKYTITFVDEDGTTVLSSDEYDYGATPVAPTDPSKTATAQYTYTFTGWSPAIATVTGAATYTAIYSQTTNKYTVTFVDEDGTTVLSSAEYEYGATPVAPADPSKAATAQYTYTFTGWTPEIAAVTGAATYTATYSQTVNKYTVTFVDEDGTTVLASAEYEYGATPVAPADPTKAATAQYTYTFTGWTPEIAAVTGAATYTATYSQTVNKYTITFVDEDGTTVLASAEYEYGATPVAPADPTKAATAQYTYTFTGWSPAIANVTGTATYTATYSQTVNKYTITFVDEDGTTVLSSAEYEYGATPVAPADPSKAATEEYTYTFSGWDKTIAVVTEAATYTATYSSQLNNVAIDGDQDLADLPVGENTHITVGEDGNLTVSEPTTIGTITVTVNGDEASEIIGVENLTVTNAEMILRLEPNKSTATPNKWYAFGVPFEVEVSGGIYAQGSASPAIYNSAFVLDEYDGSLRASTQQGWKRVSSSAILQPGVLYMIAVGSTTNEWRFVKRASASFTEQTSLSVAAYPSAIGAHHAGWNGLANTLFRDASVALDGVQYITTYNNEQSVYEVQPIAEATLAMAKPFFVQAPAAGTLHLTAQPAGVAARSLMAADEQSPSCVLSLSSADFTDRAYITAQVGKENAYSIGHDLMKMLDGTPSVPQLWLEGYNLRLAAYELALASESTTFIIPLGLYAPQNGTYTLDADTQSDYYTLTLLADDTPVAELGEQAVSIDLEQGNNSKYALRITKKADVVTDIANGTAGGIQVVKFVQDDLLYILRDGKTYTIQGVEVK